MRYVRMAALAPSSNGYVPALWLSGRRRPEIGGQLGWLPRLRAGKPCLLGKQRRIRLPGADC